MPDTSQRDLLRDAQFPKHKAWLREPMGIVEKLIVGNYAPERPILSDVDNVACLGSCFADEISKSLTRQGRLVTPIPMSERWATATAAKHFITHGLSGQEPPPGFLANSPTLNDMLHHGARMKDATAFIITLGMSLCWFARDTGEMVLDVPGGHSAGGLTAALVTHEMRQTTHDQNVSEINASIEIVRRYKPTAPIILTLSPIPLAAAITWEPVITANAMSKAVLRSAIGEVISANPRHVYYWPSYEIVDWFAKYHGPIFGNADRDLRHIDPHIVDTITSIFGELFYGTPPTA